MSKESLESYYNALLLLERLSKWRLDIELPIDPTVKRAEQLLTEVDDE